MEFSRKARDLGIQVILDLVLNHTPCDHPWFQSARRDPQSPYRDYDMWSEREPPDAHEGMVFPGKQTATWTRGGRHGIELEPYGYRWFREERRRGARGIGGRNSRRKNDRFQRIHT